MFTRSWYEIQDSVMYVHLVASGAYLTAFVASVLDHSIRYPRHGLHDLASKHHY